MAEIDEMDTHSGNGLSENVLDTSVKRQTSILPVDDGDVLLDYEAEEPDDVENLAKDSDNENADLEADSNKLDEDKSLDKIDDDSPSEAESLEEGEVSDEDEETRKERLKPQPICRFYSKGQCAWGASCRFVHPGVLDKGNYNMFAPPRPILPTEQEPIEKAIEAAEETLKSPEVEKTPTPPARRRPETAWERGLRQAKEMKRLSQQRKETDIEYEEKRTTMSLTQAELDKENDYYMRPASPLRDQNDDGFIDDIDDVPRLRRVAPPPPPEFQSRPSRRYPSPPPQQPPSRRYDSPSPPPPSRVRRVAPPRSPEIGGPRHRRGDEWADPWMRGNEGGRRASRKRSYSSGSSRSSSKSSNSSRSKSRSPKRRRRGRSSSASSRSSRSRSRSRSSTPEGIPRRNNQERSESPVNRNTAPLQKRLMNLASSSTGIIKNIKKEPEDKKKKPTSGGGDTGKDSAKDISAADAELSRGPRRSSMSPPPRRRRTKSSRSSSGASSRSSSTSRSRSPSPPPTKKPASNLSSSNHSKPAILPEEPIHGKEINREPTPEAEPEPQPPPKKIRMTLQTTSVSKSMNKSVLEKLGNSETTNKDKTPLATEQMLENVKAKREEFKLKKASEIKKEKKEKKEKKSAADRREELLKQLKAVENAIAKKRVKIGETK